MSKRTAFAAFLAVTTVALACHHKPRLPRRTGSASTSFASASAKLVTFYARDVSDTELALVHILFVPDVERSKGGSGWSSSSGGDGMRSELRLTYHGEKVKIDAHPIVTDENTLQAEGKSFDFRRGNVFVIHLRRDGSLAVRQLPMLMHDRNTNNMSILSKIKAATPDDARVQALK